MRREKNDGEISAVKEAATRPPRVWHPFFLAAYPVLYLYAHNVREARFREVLLPLALMLGGTSLLWLLLRHRWRDPYKAGLFVSVALFFFCTYGALYELLPSGGGTGCFFAQDRYLWPAWALLASLALTAVARTRRSLQTATSALNLIAGCLLILAGSSLWPFRSSAATPSPAAFVSLPEQNQRSRRAPAAASDIYYLVLDSYAREDVLRTTLGFDNRPFLGYLEKRGFYIASRSCANYGHTKLSLASSLNMEHLSALAKAAGLADPSRLDLCALLQDNAVARFVHQQGYEFVNFSSGMGITQQLAAADRNIDLTPWNELLGAFLFRMTMAEPLASYCDWDIQRAQRVFAELPRLPRTGWPVFVLAHIMLPHPFMVRPETRHQPEKKKQYLARLVLVNALLEQLIDQLLSRSGPPPVIILQGDHGHRLATGRRDPIDAFLVENLPILNAYYLGGEKIPELYPTITPVNTFRVVFNHYFHAGLPLREDRCYFTKSWYRFEGAIDVTERAFGATPPARRVAN